MQSTTRAEATIVVPQFNRAELTYACLASLRGYEPICWPVIVVDDGSAPGCAEAVMARGFRNVTVLQQPHAGVTAAWNVGARHVETPLVVFLNNDVQFSGAAVEQLVRPVRQGTALIAGAACRRERLLPADVLLRLPTKSFLQGWCFATSVETWRALGGFDEAMKVYWSDTDFQARAVREAGADGESLVGCAGLPIRHLGHRTVRAVPARSAIWRADRAAFIAKWSAM